MTAYSRSVALGVSHFTIENTVFGYDRTDVEGSENANGLSRHYGIRADGGRTALQLMRATCQASVVLRRDGARTCVIRSEISRKRVTEF